jgi:hypothetical protein
MVTVPTVTRDPGCWIKLFLQGTTRHDPQFIGLDQGIGASGHPLHHFEVDLAMKL